MKMQGVYRALLVIFIALVAKQVLATQHSVTWDQSTDMNTWASGRTFKVGDQLVFKYSPGLHSVLELSSEKEFKNCDISNALNSMSNGNDAVKLSKSGTRYFTCGTLGHCGQGMKLQVKTVAASEGPSQTSPSTTTTTSSSSTSPSAAQISHTVATWSLLVLSVIVGLLSISF